MKAKLELAISFLSGMINQASVVLETVLANHLKHVGEYADPVARAERLLDGLRQYAGPVAQAQLVQRLAVLQVLKELLEQVENDPAKELSYEFSVGRQGDDYVEGRDVTVPIVEAKLTGRTMELLGILRLVEAQIEWPERSNGFTARFIIKDR
ncbi:hypothetical protein KBI23_18790 [bacterium]|nr:hypothetical protein [bacterium]MBP9809724.1 hypothetical protein [bacterium]